MAQQIREVKNRETTATDKPEMKHKANEVANEYALYLEFLREVPLGGARQHRHVSAPVIPSEKWLEDARSPSGRRMPSN